MSFLLMGLGTTNPSGQCMRCDHLSLRELLGDSGTGWSLDGQVIVGVDQRDRRKCSQNCC
jgi:hypothetical protein